MITIHLDDRDSSHLQGLLQKQAKHGYYSPFKQGNNAITNYLNDADAGACVVNLKQNVFCISYHDKQLEVMRSLQFGK